MANTKLFHDTFTGSAGTTLSGRTPDNTGSTYTQVYTFGGEDIYNNGSGTCYSDNDNVNQGTGYKLVPVSGYDSQTISDMEVRFKRVGFGGANSSADRGSALIVALRYADNNNSYALRLWSGNMTVWKRVSSTNTQITAGPGPTSWAGISTNYYVKFKAASNTLKVWSSATQSDVANEVSGALRISVTDSALTSGKAGIGQGDWILGVANRMSHEIDELEFWGDVAALSDGFNPRIIGGGVI